MKTTVISNCNPVMYILTKQLLGGKYSKWIVILHEFDLEFEKSKSKKSLVFPELMCDFPNTETKTVLDHLIIDESLFLINTIDPWYVDISSFISKPKIFGLNSHVHIDEKSVSNLSNTILLVTYFIIVAQTLFFDDV